MVETSFENIWRQAESAGLTSSKTCTLTPMHVQETNAFGEPTKEWTVEEGVCGFGWVTLRPATSKFAKWLKLQPRTSDHLAPSYDRFDGGIKVWVTLNGSQSMQRKLVYAKGMAAVLRYYGFDATAHSRMD